MSRAATVLLITACLTLVWSGVSSADKRPAPGPGRPIFPKPERTDAELFEKAARIQARMWKHISPEGLLVDEHAVGADLDQLSFDSLERADQAFWTSSYAASQACRWAVTRDPEALLQVRVLARGMAALSDVTGYGGLARAVGRVPPGRKPISPKKVVPSPTMPGLWFRSDVSGDQVAGWTLGWACIAKFVDDEELLALARRELGQLTDHWTRNKMKLKDHRGKTTEHGDHEKSVFGLGLFNKGMTAANGFCAFSVGDALHATPRSRRQLRRLEKQGWREALDDMWTPLHVHMSASNSNMGMCALTAIRLWSTDKKTRKYALQGIRDIRQATVGWWNAGLCSCALLAKINRDERHIVPEIRVTLHMMYETEIPAKNRVKRYTSRHRSATVRERGATSWMWKSKVDMIRTPVPGSPPADHTYTRADWLFAYWLARAAGYLHPKTGRGAAETVAFDIEAPAWAVALAQEPLPAEAPARFK